MYLHTEVLQVLVRPCGELLRIARKDTGSRLKEHNARRAGINVAKILRQRHARHLCNRPGHLHAGGATAHQDEG